jgi:precorrin-6B methylase 2
MKSPLEKLFRSECIHPLAKGAYTTDKGSDHDYIEGYYAEEFGDKQDVVTDILEIGVMSGGSLILWTKWFPNANVEGIDIFPETVNRYNEIKGNSEYPNVKIHIADAYDPEVADKFTDGKYDYIIDDGPHSLDSMKNAIILYMKKLKIGGRLIIEDVQSDKWFTELASHADSLGYHQNRTFDLRKNKNRSDDMIFELTNNGTQKAK